MKPEKRRTILRVIGAGACPRTRWIALALLLAIACSLFPPALQSPAKGGAVWHEVTSGHFNFYTDLDPDEAVRTAREFETVRDALIQVAFQLSDHEPRVSVVLFARTADFKAIAPRVQGFDSAHLPLDIERHATVVVEGNAKDRAARTFVHEEVHELMYRTFGTSPIWLNEGLADYFSTIRFEDGMAVLGDVVPGRAAVGINGVPSVAEILRARAADYGQWVEDQTMRARLYTGAWLLVHFLRNGPEPYRSRWDVLVDAMAEGMAIDAAWTKAMAGLSPDRIESDFRDHVEARTWNAVGLRIEPPPSPELTVRTMSPAEVHLLWARIATGSLDWTLAAREIDEASALEPDSPEVAYERACLALTKSDLHSAAEAFRQARAHGGDDPRFLYGLALSTRDCVGSRSLRDVKLCDSLAARAETPEENAFSALYLARIDRRDEGLRRASAAFQADRRCQPCAAALADLLAASGKVRDAIDVLTQAVSIAPETPIDRTLAARLEKYRMMAPTP